MTNSFTHLFKWVKHANLSRQSVALLPLCLCTCNKDLFLHKNCLVPFVKPFHSIKFKLVLYSHIAWPNGFPMFVLHLGLWVKKHNNYLSLFERELLQWNMVIKMKIPTATFLRNLFKIMLYFPRFSRKKVKFQFRKILVAWHAR